MEDPLCFVSRPHLCAPVIVVLHCKMIMVASHTRKGTARRRVNVVPPQARRCQESSCSCITIGAGASFPDSVAPIIVIFQGYVLYSAAQLSRVRNRAGPTALHIHTFVTAENSIPDCRAHADRQRNMFHPRTCFDTMTKSQPYC